MVSPTETSLREVRSARLPAVAPATSASCSSADVSCSRIAAPRGAMNPKFFFVTAALAVSLSSAAGSAQAGTARSIDAKVEARAQALLKQMTLEEKLGQLTQLFWYKGIPDDRVKRGEIGSYLFITDP